MADKPVDLGAMVESMLLAPYKATETEDELKRKAAADLYEALKHLVHLHNCEMEGIESGMPSYKDWMDAVMDADKAIQKAEGKS